MAVISCSSLESRFNGFFMEISRLRRCNRQKFPLRGRVKVEGRRLRRAGWLVGRVRSYLLCVDFFTDHRSRAPGHISTHTHFEQPAPAAKMFVVMRSVQGSKLSGPLRSVLAQQCSNGSHRSVASHGRPGHRSHRVDDLARRQRAPPRRCTRIS